MFDLIKEKNVGGVLDLVGYFQFWKYFDHLGHMQIKKHLAFNHIIENLIGTFLLQSVNQSSSYFYISVHVRRGDYKKTGNQRRGYRVSTAEYIHRAVQYMIDAQCAKPRKCVLLVCTDDEKWAKDNVKNQYDGHSVVFSPFKSPAQDLCLLSHCNGSIITGGSYGRWGAYLARGPVVYDKDFPIKNYYRQKHQQSRLLSSVVDCSVIFEHHRQDQGVREGRLQCILFFRKRPEWYRLSVDIKKSV